MEIKVNEIGKVLKYNGIRLQVVKAIQAVISSSWLTATPKKLEPALSPGATIM